MGCDESYLTANRVLEIEVIVYGELVENISWHIYAS